MGKTLLTTDLQGPRVLASKQISTSEIHCHALLCRPCFDSPLLLRVFHKRVGDNTDDGYHIGSPLPLPCHPQG